LAWVESPSSPKVENRKRGWGNGSRCPGWVRKGRKGVLKWGGEGGGVLHRQNPVSWGPPKKKEREKKGSMRPRGVNETLSEPG